MKIIVGSFLHKIFKQNGIQKGDQLEEIQVHIFEIAEVR